MQDYDDTNELDEEAYDEFSYDEYEIYELTAGTGQISLRGDGFESALLFEGKPVAFHWSDCKGSVAQYLVRGTAYIDYKADLARIRSLVNDEATQQPLCKSLHGLLRLFAPGQYLLREYGLEDYDYLPYKAPAKDQEMLGYYPLPMVLIGTQPVEILDEATVEAFRVQIRDGQRPKVIVAQTFQNGSCFVLDGHHKLAAYRELHIAPVIIEITQVTTESMSLFDGVQCLGLYGDRHEYSRVKKKYHDVAKSVHPRVLTGNAKALFKAIRQDDIEQAAQLLQTDPAIADQGDEYQMTPLLAACASGKKAFAELLLRYKPNLTTGENNGYTAMHYAAGNNYPEIVELLFKHGGDLNIVGGDETPLDSAVGWGSLEGAEKLLELGADILAAKRDLIENAGYRDNGAQMIELLIRYGLEPTRMHQKNILFPPVRRFLDDYFVSVRGIGANMIKETAKASEHAFWNAVFGSDEAKVQIQAIMKLPSVSVYLYSMASWDGPDEPEAHMYGFGHEFMIDFYAVDYAKNRAIYHQGGDIKVAFSAFAHSVQISYLTGAETVETNTILSEATRHLWGVNMNPLIQKGEIHGLVFHVAEMTLQGKMCKLLHVQVAENEEKDRIVTLPILVYSENVKMKYLKIGDVIEGSIWLLGRIADV